MGRLKTSYPLISPCLFRSQQSLVGQVEFVPRYTRQQSTNLKTATMTSSESPHRTRSRQSRAQKRKHDDEAAIGLPFDLSTRLSKDDKDSMELLRSIFMQISPHIWWKILPSDEKLVETFTFSSGQRWYYCLPLMMKHELVKK